MTSKVIWIVISATIMSGCAATPLYQWGAYEQSLYNSYKDPTKLQTLRIGLEREILSVEKSGQRVAPGLYAELGTLYLQMGDSPKALAMYQREHDTWPESRGLMRAMISNVGRSKPASLESSK